MKLDLIQNLRQELQLRMSPQLIQRIEILQLSSLDLLDTVQKELMENEVLTIKEPVEDPPLEKKKDKELPDDDAEFEQDLERLSKLAEWNEPGIYKSSYRSSAGDADPKMEAMQNAVSKPITLQHHLKNQLSLCDAASEIKELAEQIIFNIDGRGYLLYPLEEILISLDGDEPKEKMDEALILVQGFDPKGVGARSLQECLLLQLDENSSVSRLMRKLILNHVEDISRNRLPKIARDLGVPLTTVQKTIEEIATLDPIPGRSFRRDEVPYVYPDVVVELIEGRYEIRLENNYFPRLAINRSFLRHYKDKDLDPKLRKHLREKIESAKWLIESIEQRKSTLLRVVTEIVEYQTEFLDHGPRMLKPLKMQDIADKVGIHVSTVSRAISDKYVQTHRGIFPLKYFFTGGTLSSDGTVESRQSVKQKVKEIVDKEDKSHPLSDQEIVNELKKQGLSIARRTVTKYRKALNVASSRQRRVY